MKNCLQTESKDRSFFLEGTLTQVPRLCVGYDHLGLLTSFGTPSYIGTLSTLPAALFTLPLALSTSLFVFCILLSFILFKSNLYLPLESVLTYGPRSRLFNSKSLKWKSDDDILF